MPAQERQRELELMSNSPLVAAIQQVSLALESMSEREPAVTPLPTQHPQLLVLDRTTLPKARSTTLLAFLYLLTPLQQLLLEALQRLLQAVLLYPTEL